MQSKGYPVPLVLRMIAKFIDWLVLACACGAAALIGASILPDFFFLLYLMILFSVPLLYFAGLQAYHRQTLGMRVVRLRLIRGEGGPVTVREAALRSDGYEANVTLVSIIRVSHHSEDGQSQMKTRRADRELSVGPPARGTVSVGPSERPQPLVRAGRPASSSARAGARRPPSWRRPSAGRWCARRSMTGWAERWVLV